MKFFLSSLLVIFVFFLGLEAGYLIGVYRSAEKHCEPIKDREEYRKCVAEFEMGTKK